MNENNDKTALAPVTDVARRMSAADLAQWGLNVVAYVRKVEGAPGGEAFAIYAANGEAIGMAGSHAAADVGLRQNDIELVSVH
ncbi:MAG: hypothetical protein AAB543_02200 [Pseudomonadota bacterium]